MKEKLTETIVEFQGAPMKCQLTEISREDIPACVQREKTSRWDVMLTAFVESAAEVVRLDADWPKGTTNGQVESVYGSIRNRIKKRGLQIECMRRKGDVYLIKKRA